jgi:CRISPR-associated protein Cas2
MPRASLLTVFAYDVVDDGARRRVAGILEDCAVRVQDSVFESWMTQRLAKATARKIERHLKQGDSLRVYVIGNAVSSRCHVFGGPALQDTDSYILI